MASRQVQSSAQPESKVGRPLQDPSRMLLFTGQFSVKKVRVHNCRAKEWMMTGLRLCRCRHGRDFL